MASGSLFPSSFGLSVAVCIPRMVWVETGIVVSHMSVEMSVGSVSGVVSGTVMVSVTVVRFCAGCVSVLASTAS